MFKKLFWCCDTSSSTITTQQNLTQKDRRSTKITLVTVIDPYNYLIFVGSGISIAGREKTTTGIIESEIASACE